MDRLNYFGYASNLKESLLKERIGGDHPLSVDVGRLLDYELRFNHQQPNGEGRANIVPKKGSYIYGLVYGINNEHRDLLFKTEPGYRMIEVDIELQSDQSTIRAITFIDETSPSENYRPSNEYLRTIIDGACEHDFPQDYIDSIISIIKSTN
ncbi:unnamed protein product [Adineta ricciae]|uniref:gamma-glutamylcyclotransferase n=1 Tax=Adineta ricciae TaxID=249248 RepID=A0A814IB63_ADIRI|nr:unnamed protein product [Adineta ricciae]CAF1020915.1 unnamed protein product [Adineta ricciae]